MSKVVSFENYRPPARFDGNPWTEAQIDEATTSAGPWTTIDTITFATPDTDPADPAERSFTTPNGTAADLWYTVTFLDIAGGKSTPTTPVQNTTTGSTPYATTGDLFRILKVRTPTEDQIEAAQGDLDTATLEINAEIDLVEGAVLTTAELELVRGVCIDRAADLWRHRESVPGVLGGLDDVVQVTPGRYSWERYAQRLQPIKQQWGLA